MAKATIIALFNQSGGVGKTSLTMNLGYHLAQAKCRVLLIDMDPQGSLTAFMGLEPAELEMTIVDSVLRGKSLSIHRDIHGMDLVPSNILLSAAEKELVSAMAREWKLSKALEPIAGDYEFILIDAPPSLGILSILALVAANYVLVPIQTQWKCYKGTDLLLDTLKEVREEVNPKLEIVGIIPAIYDSRNAHDNAVLEAIKRELAAISTIYPSVPRATAFADASMERQPLAVYSRSHAAIKSLKSIAASLEKLR